MTANIESESGTRDPVEMAAYWHCRLEDGTADTTDEVNFAAWLAADSRNRSAYRSVEKCWNGMAASASDVRILALRREALGEPHDKSGRPTRILNAALSVAALGCLFGGVFVSQGGLGHHSNVGEFATRIGERSSIVLPDGSKVVLNTASLIQTEFDGKVRRVHLIAGEAWFEVTKDQTRPFIVDVGDRRVTAHGTAFDVRLEGSDRIEVTLVEGRVSVDQLADGQHKVRSLAASENLLPGEQLTVVASQPVDKHRGDVAKATIWREGQIIFDNDTLATAVAEINRYSARKIILTDPSLASLRMSGVFIVGHSASFLETVTSSFPIAAVVQNDGNVLLKSGY